MLSQPIGDLLPSAVGVALSPIPIVAIILMLATPKARTNGLAFTMGWIVGLLVVTIVVLLIAGGANSSDAKSDGSDWLKIVLGVVFFAMARRQWQKRPAKGETAEMPKWMATIDRFTAGRSLVLGAALSAVNPKNLALTAAAAASIAQVGLSGGETAITVVVFIVISSITVAGPVLFYLVAPTEAAGPLATVKDFMSEHNAVIMMVILVVLGAKLLGSGIGGLGS